MKNERLKQVKKENKIGSNKEQNWTESKSQVVQKVNHEIKR